MTPFPQLEKAREMKTIAALTVALLVTATSTARAASLIVEHAGGTHTVYLDGAQHNGNFDTIYFEAHPNAIELLMIRAGVLVQQINYVPSLAEPQMGLFANLNSGLSAGLPRPPGLAYTNNNRTLDADPIDVPQSQGWTIIGVTRTPSEVSFTGGPLGGTISTAGQPGGRLFLANLYAPIPEPPTAALVAALATSMIWLARSRPGLVCR
jgi:hypothetical protein